jgi:hypothetical protein
MSLLLQRAPMTARRSIMIVGLIVFGVNAKMMHIIPLIGMVVVWAVLPRDDADTPPQARSRRFAIALGLLAAGWFGLRFNRLLAGLFLDGAAYQTFVANETLSINENSGTAILLSTPLSELPLYLTKTILWNGLRSIRYLGVLQGPLLALGLIATAAVARRRVRQSSLARLAVVLLAGTAAHFAWWASETYHTTRHLTPIAVLACFALGCGFGLAWIALNLGAASASRERLAWGGALALFCIAGAPDLFTGLRGWSELREHRNQQVNAAAALERLAAKYPDASFCGSGWYVPRELTYLAPAGVKFCSVIAVRPSTPGPRILMLASNLWPAYRKEEVRAADERCTAPIERIGRFEFRGCDGFRPDSTPTQPGVDEGT